MSWEDSIDNYVSWWTTHKHNYRLLRRENGTDENGKPKYRDKIYHVPSRSLMLIEDPKVYVEIKKRMREAGVLIIFEIPH